MNSSTQQTSSAKKASSKKQSSSTKSLDIITPPWKLALGACAGAAVFIVIWSFYGRIPIRIQGRGIFFPIPAASRVISSDYGRVHLFLPNSESQSPAWFEQIIPSLDNRSSLKGPKLGEFVSQLLVNVDNIESSLNNSSNSSSFSSFDFPIKIPSNKLILYSESSSKKADLASKLGNYLSLQKQSDENRNLKFALQNQLNDQLSQRVSLQSSLKSLSDIGFLSKTATLSNLQIINSIKSQIQSLKQSTLSLTTSLDSSEAELRSSLNYFVESTLFYGDQDLFIQNITTNLSDYQVPNTTLLTYTNELKIYPEKIPIYFAARDISQLKPGDSGFASVIGFNRTQFGGIKLKIDGRENLSTISEDITSRLGLQGFSKDIGSNFISPTLAIASLKLSDPFDKKNPYEWTLVSSTRPELNLGDKLDVEVVVRRDSPISFVIPALKGLLGITPEPPKSVKPKAKQL